MLQKRKFGSKVKSHIDSKRQSQGLNPHLSGSKTCSYLIFLNELKIKNKNKKGDVLFLERKPVMFPLNEPLALRGSGSVRWRALCRPVLWDRLWAPLGSWIRKRTLHLSCTIQDTPNKLEYPECRQGRKDLSNVVKVIWGPTQCRPGFGSDSNILFLLSSYETWVWAWNEIMYRGCLAYLLHIQLVMKGMSESITTPPEVNTSALGPWMWMLFSWS